MRVESKCTVFTPAFLARLRRLEKPPSSRETVLRGPWDAEPIRSEDGLVHAVSRRDEPVAEGGRAFGAFATREAALQTAAVLPSVGTPLDLHLSRHTHRLGFALHEGQEFLGHVAREEPALPPQLHLARRLATDPEALALLLEAAGPEALALLGRVLHRRLAG